MNVSNFDFDLPDELIAQEPPAVRGDSRLLVLGRASGQIEHTSFSRVAEYLRRGDLLVLNNTKVFPARLLGHRLPGGGAAECLLLRQVPTPQLPTPNSQRPTPELPTPNSQRPTPLPIPQLSIPDVVTPKSVAALGRSPLEVGNLGVEELRVGNRGGGNLGVEELGVGSSVWWEALMHPGQRLKPGTHVVFEREGVRLQGEVVQRHFHGRRTIRLWNDENIDVAEAIDRIGHVPLPPYIKRQDQPTDRDRYQTVYARERGSIAAPTAGLHFTDTVLDALVSRGVERAELTLHVGYGTFKPIRVANIEDHLVDPEAFTVPPKAATALTQARSEGRRIIAVGTTTVRALESLAMEEDGRIKPLMEEAQLFIRPGHEFRLVDGLITNFHLPRSSLLLLVAAFAGRDRILAAYREAVARGYRFYSYGDAMLIL